jgi:alpha(1,3/1,4) fucosyltransferase
MRKTIKIGFTDYFPGFDEFFTDVLSSRYNLVRDDKNPDYLFFCDETFGTRNQSYDPNKTKLIFFTGENRRPWNYRCHHAISFDHLESKQFYRLPLYVIEEWFMVNKLKMRSMEDQLLFPSHETTGFCGFVISNGNCAERNNIFHKLCEYKKVDSGGPHLNNIGYVLPRGPTAQINKIAFLESKKFSLCYENSSYPGYVTEKLFHGFYARTIPIYWGSPCVEMDFNTNAFISRHDFKNDEEMIEHIKYLDSNDELYKHMLTLNPWNYRNKWKNTDNFLDWFGGVVV